MIHTGSLESDTSRKIAKIEYDYNNNPVRIQFTNGIDKYQFEEGYCEASAAGSVDYFDSYYYDRDHLGNVRRVIEPNGTNKSFVIQRMNYYPFGAEFCDNSTKNFVQNHKYNGKEFDHMHGLNTYDYGARQYNPVTARWDRMDSLCEKYYSTSPYAYCENDPVNTIDPDGRSGWKVLLKATYKIGKSVAKHGTKSLTNAATYAEAFKDIVDDTKTVFDSNASTGDRLIAGFSLLTEIASPVSLNDANAINNIAKTAKNACHGNSKLSTKAQHAYDIIDKRTGNRVKTGVSGGKIRKDGKSYRADQQVRKWNKEAGGDYYESTITHHEPARPNARSNILEYERKRSAELRKAGELDEQKHQRP